ncbi:solute carrier family 28 member 3-like [Amphiura filiformis]|uniref:solute carrier family 28 member 3-like n=1 Tax=Amphiura filiformis TaxID=82378 RepID=UPI003B211D7A
MADDRQEQDEMEMQVKEDGDDGEVNEAFDEDGLPHPAVASADEDELENPNIKEDGGDGEVNEAFDEDGLPHPAVAAADEDEESPNIKEDGNDGEVNEAYDEDGLPHPAVASAEDDEENPNGIEVIEMEEPQIVAPSAYKHDQHSRKDQFWDATENLTDDSEEFYAVYKKVIWTVIGIILLFLYATYFIAACYINFQRALILVILTGIVLFCALLYIIWNQIGDDVYERVIKRIVEMIDEYWPTIRWPFYIGLLIAYIIALAFLTKDNPIQLISAAGLKLLVFLTFCFSKSPRHVKWRPVLWGMWLQFIFGLLILRTKVGFDVFTFLGDLVNNFLNFTDAGASFVFGELFTNHFFAFKVLPLIIYFSSFVSILYYLGVMQFVIVRIAWLMNITMKTSAGESLNAAGNIFIGQTEAPLLVKPYLNKMTKSELHAIMTGGFATIAGGVFGAYVSFGISPSHLLGASVMSAPAALAMAKLFYPETEESKLNTKEEIKLDKSTERNIIEAAANGAATAIPLALNIAGNLIAFLGLLAFLNALLGYFGGLVDIHGLSFELICSYVFMPLAFMMGVEWEDCREVAELIGIKTFINEFVAYIRLSGMIDQGQISASIVDLFVCLLVRLK